MEQFQSLILAVMCFIEEALIFVDSHHLVPTQPYMKSYIEWMRYQQQRLANGQMVVNREAVRQMLHNTEKREHFMDELENSGAEGAFFVQIGRNLISILDGRTTALHLMFEAGLADRYYAEGLTDEHVCHPALAFVDLLCFKNPSMNIIEVGAGTGGQTLPLLTKMSEGGSNRWARYDVTDISSGFFGQAQEKLQRFLHQMEFRVRDISKDPLSQSFEKEGYDLVIASHVLHATDNLDLTLQNVRKLLKPNGKLLLFETTDPDAAHIGFAFGLLKDWWGPIDRDSRSLYSPCLKV